MAPYLLQRPVEVAYLEGQVCAAGPRRGVVVPPGGYVVKGDEFQHVAGEWRAHLRQVAAQSRQAGEARNLVGVVVAKEQLVAECRLVEGDSPVEIVHGQAGMVPGPGGGGDRHVSSPHGFE